MTKEAIDPLKIWQIKLLGTAATKQNLIQEETKRRLNPGNAC
jgi:hypothetical protein